MGSNYDLAGPTKWLNWFLGPTRQGAARSYFGSTAYFSRHSRRGGVDPFLQISPTSVYNSGCLHFQLHKGWRTALLGWHLWVVLRFFHLLREEATSLIEWRAQVSEAGGVRIYIYEMVSFSITNHNLSTIKTAEHNINQSNPHHLMVCICCDTL